MDDIVVGAVEEVASYMLTKLMKGDLSILSIGKPKRKSGETEESVEDSEDSAPTNASKQAKINPSESLWSL